MPVSAALPPSAPTSWEIYLLGGQSNMSGRGFLSEAPSRYANGNRIMMFSNAWQWTTASDPLDSNTGEKDVVSDDGPTNPGVGPGMSFASKLADLRPNVGIGLVPCAMTSTAMTAWAKSTNLATLYAMMLLKAKMATRFGTVKGLLWYQGESDGANSSDAAAWSTRFLQMVSDFRTDIGIANLPVVFTVLCANPSSGSFPYWDTVVSQQQATTGTAIASVTAQDLPVRTDDPAQKVHLSTAGQITLGQRMASAMNAML